MLGSAIPKRLVFSLTLVGLVSLLMFSDAGLSFERASAQEGVGVTLTSVTSPSTSTYPAGTVVNVTTSVTDENGFVNGTLANDNYAWATTCGTVTANTTVPQTTFTAPSSACTGTISVDAYQDTATTSTVQDVDTITAAGTGAGDRSSAVAVDASPTEATTLAAGINASVTTFDTAADGTNGIIATEYIKVGSEIMLVSAVTDANTFGTVVRGVHGTTAAAHLINAALVQVIIGTELSVAITDVAATSITVDSSAMFAAGEYAKIGTEIVKITAAPTATTLTVVRGQFGTTAATASIDDEVIEVTVTGTLAAGDTTLAVLDGSVFAANDYVEIGSEVLKISAVATNVLTVSRGQFGTTDATHAVDATITKQVTASSSQTVQVNNPAAAEPAPTYTDPSPVPEIVPDGLTADDVAVIIPSAGGSFTEVGGTASITVPAGAVANGTAAAVGIVSVATSGLPSPPAAASEGASSGTFTFGSSAINVQWYDATGAAQATYSLNKPAEICLPFTQDDINGAAGGPDGLGIWRHNGSEWVTLNATANVGSGTVCGNASSFSSFALGLDVAAPGAATGGGGGEVSLPGTGGYSPAVTTLLLALMAGIVMVVVGSFTARRVLWARDLS